MALAGCHRSGDLRVAAVASHESCSRAGWAHVAFEGHASRAGRLEVDVVDRIAIAGDEYGPMTANETRPLLATVDRSAIRADETIPFEWSFASEPPPPAPPPDLCKDLADDYSIVVQNWQDPRMCTREVSKMGPAGGSTSLFEPSCFAHRGWRPRQLTRAEPADAALGEWVWLAAWVWAPPDAKVVLTASGNSWSYTVDGVASSIEDDTYPAWTLRARLVANNAKAN
jgi:hypothetical protein